MPLTKEFQIDGVTYLTAQSAIRDILFMYYVMLDFDGFGNDVDCGRFNPYWFLRTRIVEPGFMKEDGVRVLQEGSAVKLLNMAGYSFWEHAVEYLSSNAWGELSETGALCHLPLANQALALAFYRRDQFERDLRRVYKTYVLRIIRAR